MKFVIREGSSVKLDIKQIKDCMENYNENELNETKCSKRYTLCRHALLYNNGNNYQNSRFISIAQ